MEANKKMKTLTRRFTFLDSGGQEGLLATFCQGALSTFLFAARAAQAANLQVNKCILLVFQSHHLNNTVHLRNELFAIN